MDSSRVYNRTSEDTEGKPQLDCSRPHAAAGLICLNARPWLGWHRSGMATTKILNPAADLSFDPDLILLCR